jgi:hypothetical protein
MPPDTNCAAIAVYLPSASGDVTCADQVPASLTEALTVRTADPDALGPL